MMLFSWHNPSRELLVACHVQGYVIVVGMLKMLKMFLPNVPLLPILWYKKSGAHAWNSTGCGYRKFPATATILQECGISMF